MKTEKGFAGIFFIGLIFWFLHWPGASLIIIFSLGSLSLLYLFGSFYVLSDKTLKQQNLALSILSGFIFSAIVIAVCFKIMFWTGAQNMLLWGGVWGLILLVVVYVLRRRNTPLSYLNKYYDNMFLRAILFAIIAWFSFLVSSKTLLEIEYRNDPEMARLKYLYYTNPTEENTKLHDEYVKHRRDEQRKVIPQ